MMLNLFDILVVTLLLVLLFISAFLLYFSPHWGPKENLPKEVYKEAHWGPKEAYTLFKLIKKFRLTEGNKPEVIQ